MHAGRVQFIDAGENLESLNCPWCGRSIDIEWWTICMEEAWSTGFEDLRFPTECCDAITSLNDLRYHFPQGFARWWVEVMNPTVATLSDDQLAAIAEAVGHPVRAIYRYL